MSDNIVLERADLEAAILKSTEKFEQAVEKAQGQANEAGSASAEAKAAVDKLAEKAADAVDRIIALEQRETDVEASRPLGLGEQFVKSDGYKAMVEGRQQSVRFESKTAIVNTYPESSVQPLVQGDRMMNIFTTPNRRLTLRDLLPVSPTSSNLIEFTRESTLTSPLALAA